MIDSITSESEVQTGKLVNNGWFVTLQGTVYVIVNGSAYWVDAVKTPMVDLPPGDYTDKEVEALLAKAKYYGEKPGERDEQGRFGAGGGAGAIEGPKPKGPTNYKMSDFAPGGVTVTADGPEYFLKTWNENVRMAPREFRDKMLGGMDGHVNVVTDSGFPEMMQWYCRFRDDDGQPLGKADGTFRFNEKTAKLGYMEFESAEQGKGHAKQLLASQAQVIQQMGVETVKFDASLQMGGYAWAKYGGVPDKDSWLGLQIGMSAQLINTPEASDALKELINSDDPRAIWAIADNKEWGKKFLAGTDWQGSVSTKDPVAMKRFAAYISGQKQPAKKVYQ